MVHGRTLILSGSVDDQMAAEVMAYTSSRRGSLRILLNSQGGDMYSMLAILDWIDLHPSVVTVASGSCMSAAVPIVASGSKRLATPSTRFMLHHGAADMPEGTWNQRELRTETKEIAALEGLYFRALSHCTDRPVRFWKEYVGNGTRYFGASEALELGIIDGILER